MNLIDHSIAWCKGEIFEARIILIVGVLLALATFAFWKVGTTPFAKAAVVPVLVLTLLVLAMGISMTVSNNSRIAKFSKAYAQDPQAFIEAEKQRAEEFIAWYPRTRWILTVVGLSGALLMMYGSANWKSIGMVLLALMLLTFVIDHFSEERALIYYEEIEMALN